MIRMKAKILGYVAQEINRLTNDEDLRQELWLHFLEGTPPFLLKFKLQSIEEKNKVNNDMLVYVSMENLDGFKAKL